MLQKQQPVVATAAQQNEMRLQRAAAGPVPDTTSSRKTLRELKCSVMPLL